MAAIFKESGIPRLMELADVWDVTLHQVRERLASPEAKHEVSAALRGLKQGMRDLPKLIKSINKERGDEMILRIEHELGLKLTK